MSSDIAIFVSTGLATAVGTIAVIVNLHINRRNRRINNTLQLARDFDQDHTFVKARMYMWEKFLNLPNNRYNWEDLVNEIQLESKSKELSTITKDDLIALNRVAAFYKMIAGLVANKEVDIPLLRSLFCYNYNRLWQPVRGKFEVYAGESDKALFVSIPELESKI
ncbi:DUF4760 domain-containing protein [Paraglaciecola chathamensis]|jgi:hypothetical protein|uniref:DUF4760 domain-containing protein n=2 Tax=Paraglaciecola chathamensis TaxID=368405 RepID=A0ABQ0IC68_9ALTE|nr:MULTISPECIES: hypothetical protein [Paraglaciecola]AEE24402.1 hypothetical protein Glaag_3468 [Glaciecola sp. 4H-3-7+YE-5]MBN25582.1 hypothetical protein [Alteromonadaceae bacterium]GAC06868.1 hypothetical protein GAGA_4035 [Paraglaciecola agarilytica NO2]GAC08379.1 hypothetical protein GCHA_0415 [Paraglaciecola chathamensis S18K6]|tara:strand:+ start:122715 stop:123209 length:495 start_codon:yes stop_codon:yes gene_type:complete